MNVKNFATTIADHAFKGIDKANEMDPVKIMVGVGVVAATTAINTIVQNVVKNKVNEVMLAKAKKAADEKVEKIQTELKDSEE